MRVGTALSVFCLLFLPWTAWGQTDPPVETFRPVTPDQASVPIAPAGSLAAADRLQPRAKCHPTQRRAAIVALEWQPVSSTGVEAQRVDISMFHDGFATGRYETTEHLLATTSGVSVEAPEPLINYYWRVLTRSPGGWTSSPVERFEVPVCPYDPPSTVFGEAVSTIVRPAPETGDSRESEGSPESEDSPESTATAEGGSR